jgi:hypothetical protein
MRNVMITLMTAALLLTGVKMLSAAGDLIVDGSIGVGTLTPDQKLVVENGIVKTFGGYGTQGFVSDLVGDGDDPTATSLTSGLERATFLFSVCEGCNAGSHSFAIQARPRANVLLGQTARSDTVFEIRQDGRSSIGKYEPMAWLDVSASGNGSFDLLRLSSDDATNGDILIVDNTGNVGIGNNNPSEKLYVDGNIYATGNVSWGSSRELKKDIRELSDEEAIIALNSLNPQKYFYKADSKDEHLGFIAEDVPELLATADRKSLDPMDIVAVLTKVMQEQQRTISELTERVKDLESKEGLMNAMR